ncbi:MAG: hypothetical protein AAB509_00565 [Patescibacteria group bacterium]
MKPVIIRTQLSDGGVRFVLCHNKKGVWISEAIPVFGGKYDGGWIASEHVLYEKNNARKAAGYFFEDRGQAIKAAKSMIRHKCEEILNR